MPKPGGIPIDVRFYVSDSAESFIRDTDGIEDPAERRAVLAETLMQTIHAWYRGDDEHHNWATDNIRDTEALPPPAEPCP